MSDKDPAEDPPAEEEAPPAAEEAPPAPTPPPAEEEAPAPAPEKKKEGGDEKKKGSKKANKEMQDFKHLMVKGLELKKFKGDKQLPEKCVIYMDVACRTLFCGKKKNSPSASTYPIDFIKTAKPGDQDKLIVIVHKEGTLELEVSSPKVRDYLVRMMNKLFAYAQSEEGKAEAKKPKPPAGKKKEGEGANQKTSQVGLLAQHCYTMTDEKIENMVTAKIPTHSRWESYQEFKDKINRRDELIRALQDGLGTINAERIRFQRAVEDVETNHHQELGELKQHLAMALTSFQELQRASEHRETDMREGLKGAMERSSKFENERSTLLESMNDQRMNAGVALKEVEMLKAEVQKLQNSIVKKQNEFEDARKRFGQVKEALTVERNLRARAEIKEEQMRQETIAITGQMHATTHSLEEEDEANQEAIKAKTEELEGKISAIEAEKTETQEMYDNELKKNKVMTAEADDLKQKLDAKGSEAAQLQSLAGKAGELEGLLAEKETLEAEIEVAEGKAEKEVADLTKKTDDMEKKLLEMDALRRFNHNLIQELRGNIRVYVRIRPFLSGDREAYKAHKELGAPSCTQAKADNVTAEIVKYSGPFSDADRQIEDTHSWEFDKVFGPQNGQSDIFEEVSEFVQSALDGYNVCLFSYGQTGSGKTHTMQGAGTGEHAGIIPRAIGQIGEYKAIMEPKGWVYVMHVTFVEIYNEIVYDLLRSDDAEKEALNIKMSADGKTFVDGVTMVPTDPTSEEQIENLMTQAAKHRATSATNMNAQSSRSHSVFTLHLTGVNEEQEAKIAGQLHLCDLAGSERVGRSGVEGARLKEAININKSLSCLTDVFACLGKKNAHIPFRNSKLTHLLQPALAGDGKTMMFVNLSPTDESYFESLCSLRFAANVNQVELGKAVKNVGDISKKDKDGKSPKKGDKSPPKGAKGGKQGMKKRSQTMR